MGELRETTEQFLSWYYLFFSTVKYSRFFNFSLLAEIDETTFLIQ